VEVTGARRAWRIASLRARAAHGRARLAGLSWLHPGLRVDPSATPGFGVARMNLAPTAKLTIGAGAATEYRPGALNFVIHDGGEIEICAGAWLRTEIAPVTLVAFPGARLVVGPEVMLNGSSVSAKRSVTIARRAIVGPGTRIYDSDQHALDDARPEQIAPVEIGEFAWIAADVTVMRGVSIGAHAVVGARSVVTRDVPAHALAFGVPAALRGSVGDRSNAR
jgi:acetyltransferase-like isoleucine patch superfamily enzyme